MNEYKITDVDIRNGERIPFCWLMSSKFVDETVELVISRKGERKTIKLPLQRLQLLVPTHIDETPDGAINEAKAVKNEQSSSAGTNQPTARTRGGKAVQQTKKTAKEEVVLAEAQLSRKPQYFIVGGLVFVPLTEPYIKSEYGDEFDFRAPVSWWSALRAASAGVTGSIAIVLYGILWYGVLWYGMVVCMVLLQKADPELDGI